MRMILLTPGSGDNFYCENCLRDLTLTKALIRAGHEITMVPMYLPIKMDETVSAASSPLFMGGINVYLQQKFPLFRKTPRWLDAWFDHPKLLRRIGKYAGMTSARELGKTTLSMLQGEHGKQQKEIARLTDWLAEQDPRPELVIVSNILLAGLVDALKEKLHIPVVCLLQDEEDFLDTLPEPFREQSWQLVRQKARSFDLFIAVSDYYRGEILKRLADVAAAVEILPVGIDPAVFSPAPQLPEIPTLGYLSRMCYDHGLDILITAVHLLAGDKRLANLQLRITGGSTSADAGFLKQMRQRIETLGLSERVEFIEEFHDPALRARFLRSLSLMVLPSRKPLAYGLFAIESLAAGVPFVTPDLGVFNELANNTRAGILYNPNNPVKLAETLGPLLLAPHLIQQMGRQGAAAVNDRYAIDKTVTRMTELFGSLSCR